MGTPVNQRSIDKPETPSANQYDPCAAINNSSNKHHKSQSSSKPSARKNTRYGEPEESLIHFDLTVDQREGDDEDDISLIVVKKGEKSQRTRRDMNKGKANDQYALGA